MNDIISEEEKKWLDKLNKYAEKCKKIDAATCWETDKEVAESIEKCMSNYSIAGLYIIRLPKAKKFVIGYKPEYFHDVSFAPLKEPLTGKEITNMEDLLLKIKLTDLFDCENKYSFSINDLRVLYKHINKPEFLQYLTNLNEKKKSDKNYKLLKISSIINSNEKEI